MVEFEMWKRYVNLSKGIEHPFDGEKQRETGAFSLVILTKTAEKRRRKPGGHGKCIKRGAGEYRLYFPAERSVLPPGTADRNRNGRRAFSLAMGRKMC